MKSDMLLLLAASLIGVVNGDCASSAFPSWTTNTATTYAAWGWKNSGSTTLKAQLDGADSMAGATAYTVECATGKALKSGATIATYSCPSGGGGTTWVGVPNGVIAVGTLQCCDTNSGGCSSITSCTATADSTTMICATAAAGY